MIKVTIEFSGNSISKSVSAGTTVGAVISDANLKAVLGFGSNVEAQIDGVTAANDAALSEGDTVTIVTKANTKA